MPEFFRLLGQRTLSRDRTRSEAVAADGGTAGVDGAGDGSGDDR